MKIQVFGSGCATCKKMHEWTVQAVKELGLAAEVEYSTDITKIIEMGVMRSPVLAIDGEPVLVGKPGYYDEIRQTIHYHLTSLPKD